jgi:hypothetical protein
MLVRRWPRAVLAGCWLDVDCGRPKRWRRTGQALDKHGLFADASAECWTIAALAFARCCLGAGCALAWHKLGAGWLLPGQRQGATCRPKAAHVLAWLTQTCSKPRLALARCYRCWRHVGLPDL